MVDCRFNDRKVIILCQILQHEVFPRKKYSRNIEVYSTFNTVPVVLKASTKLPSKHSCPLKPDLHWWYCMIIDVAEVIHCHCLLSATTCHYFCTFLLEIAIICQLWFKSSSYGDYDWLIIHPWWLITCGKEDFKTHALFLQRTMSVNQLWVL